MSVVSSGATNGGKIDGLPDEFVQPATTSPNNLAYFTQVLEQNGSPHINPNACSGFFGQVWTGFASYPRGWVAAILQVIAISGAIGSTQKMRADLRNQALGMILYEAIEHREETGKILYWYISNVLPNRLPQMYGRYLGGKFTNWALFRGIPKSFRGLNAARAASNTILASYGSAILGIEKGERKLSHILGMVITGQYNFDFCRPRQKISGRSTKIIVWSVIS